MIDWIDDCLGRWGKWAARVEAGGLGFPRYSPSCRERRSDSWGDGSLPSDLTDDDMDQISAAVDSLPMLPGKPLRSIVLHRYKGGWPYQRIAGHFLMSPQSARDAMHAAHSLVADKLQSHATRE